MLRITITTRSRRTTLALEGRLAGPWVDCLRTCWQTAIACREPGSIDIHLVDVAFVDTAGRSLLRAFHEQGARLTAADLVTRGILEAITRDAWSDGVDGDEARHARER
jgi:ABC-type transporter Mla MlaB component